METHHGDARREGCEGGGGEREGQRYGDVKIDQSVGEVLVRWGEGGRAGTRCASHCNHLFFIRSKVDRLAFPPA